MNYAIEHVKKHNITLVVTPRKKVLKHCLIHVHQGLVLFKLKKFEYAIEKGQSFWIPADCLTSLSFFPDSVVTKIEFSVRLKDTFPSQAGYVRLGIVSDAILQKLAKDKISTNHKANLLQVLRDEVGTLKPELNLSSLGQQFSRWSYDSACGLSQEMNLLMKVREARKLILSGSKRDDVIRAHFSDSKEQFEQLTKVILGTSL